jgi:hypothetical protein
MRADESLSNGSGHGGPSKPQVGRHDLRDTICLHSRLLDRVIDSKSLDQYDPPSWSGHGQLGLEETRGGRCTGVRIGLSCLPSSWRC